MKARNITIFLIIIVILGLSIFTAFNGLKIGNYTIQPAKSSIRQGLDLKGGVYVVYEAQTDKTGRELDELIEQVVGVFGRRVDSMGLTEPSITREGGKRIRVELPGVENAQEAIDMIGKTAQLQFVTADGEVVVTGANVVKSQATLGQGNAAQVSLQFDKEGAKKFADVTGRLVNLGNDMDKVIYIILDEEVISSPMVSTRIPDGQASITGNFTIETASDLAALIRAGALPVNLEEVQTSTTTATLGENALNRSLQAAKIGIILVFLFMLLYYRIPGLVASIALSIYIMLVIGTMMALKATFTLPGIAALILSVGMAVDANVIIFERIKEEMGLGKSIRASIDLGFKHALSSIIDSSITTLIAGIILYQFGTGPIKGFAVMLMIGIVAGIFTSVILTKYLLKLLVGMDLTKNSKLYGADLWSLKKGRFIDIVRKRKVWISISGVIVIIGLVLGLARGVNLGIDFTGGTLMEIEFNKYVSTEEIKEIVDKYDENSNINMLGSEKTTVQIRMNEDFNNEQRKEIFEDFKTKYNLAEEDLLRADQFGPSVGREIQNKALLAIVISIIGMLIYITFRFEFSFAISAIITLAHDILIVLAMYSILRIPINSPFVAAILTILGYSINDTIVIFDRIRENLKFAKKTDYTKVANDSISQSITRSINTSLTTLVTIVALYVLGVDQIREFALPLIIGIITGTYSSVFIASPLWVMVKQKQRAK